MIARFKVTARSDASPRAEARCPQESESLPDGGVWPNHQLRPPIR